MICCICNNYNKTTKKYLNITHNKNILVCSNCIKKLEEEENDRNKQ